MALQASRLTSTASVSVHDVMGSAKKLHRKSPLLNSCFSNQAAVLQTAWSLMFLQGHVFCREAPRLSSRVSVCPHKQQFYTILKQIQVQVWNSRGIPISQAPAAPFSTFQGKHMPALVHTDPYSRPANRVFYGTIWKRTCEKRIASKGAGFLIQLAN